MALRFVEPCSPLSFALRPAIGNNRFGDRTGCIKEFTMRYRSVAMSVAALSLAQISVADAQSVYVAPGGVYIANGNVYVAPAPAPYGPLAPGVAAPASVYVAPGNGAPVAVYAAPPAGYGPPAPVYAAPAPAYGGTVYAAPAPAYGGGTVYGAPAYVERAPAYVVRERVVPPLSAYAAEIAPRPPAPVPYYGRGRW
jgi:hypothetical protein